MGALGNETHGRFWRLLFGGAGHFLSYSFNSGNSKHRFDRMCVKEIKQAGAELSNDLL